MPKVSEDNSKKVLKPASCDKLGQVYLAEDFVYRRITCEEKSSVEQVFTILNDVQDLGIIRTEIEKSPHELQQDATHSDTFFLKHHKVKFISYPHEWCAPMLKDAALFHLWLSIRLNNINLYLKDAHPWNLLFDNGRFVFVDYTSIVNRELLFAEDYLDAGKQFSNSSVDIRLGQIILEIFARMFFPYFFTPLYAYSCNTHSMIANRILETTLNTSNKVMFFNEYSPKINYSTRYIKLALEYIITRIRLYLVQSRFNRDHNPVKYYQGLIQIIKNIEVSNKQSAYSDYYQAKGEDDGFERMDSWNSKQRNIFKILEKSESRTVLDVACNTGWYSLIAESLGKRVVAIDIDHSCIEILYTKVKNKTLDILPLVINFTDLPDSRNSTLDGNPVLFPVYDRLRCDTVLALGIIHHLVLGEGLNLRQVVEHLVQFCKKQLILEFISLDDDKIKQEPKFFPAYNANPSAFIEYNINNLLTILGKYFTSIDTEGSYPNSRTLIVCNK